MNRSSKIIMFILFILVVSIGYVVINYREPSSESDYKYECPKCGSLNIEIIGEDQNQKSGLLKLNCNNCGHIWEINSTKIS